MPPLLFRLFRGKVCRNAYTFALDKDCALYQDIQEISWTHTLTFGGSGVFLRVSYSDDVPQEQRQIYNSFLKPQVESHYPFPLRFTAPPLLERAMKIDGEMLRVRENKRKVADAQLRLARSIRDIKESLNLQKEHID